MKRRCYHVFRPPRGQHRLQRLGAGRIAVELQRTWADGTSHLVFTPGELLERLSVLVPRPQIDVLLNHGVVPNARWRRAIVPAEAEEENGGAPHARAASAAAPARAPAISGVG
jgi:hypothetical protein